MLDLDIKQFWKDDELAHRENCFSKEAPQVALGIRMSDECVFAELGEEGEPWGYTPLESCAFGVPTVTTSLSGFGKWALSIGKDTDIFDGVAVVSRNDSNYQEVVAHVAEQISRLAEMPVPEVKILRQEARKIAVKAEWRNFIKYYNSAFDFALKAAMARTNTK